MRCRQEECPQPALSITYFHRLTCTPRGLIARLLPTLQWSERLIIIGLAGYTREAFPHGSGVIILMPETKKCGMSRPCLISNCQLAVSRLTKELTFPNHGQLMV